MSTFTFARVGVLLQPNAEMLLLPVTRVVLLTLTILQFRRDLWFLVPSLDDE